MKMNIGRVVFKSLFVISLLALAVATIGPGSALADQPPKQTYFIVLR